MSNKKISDLTVEDIEKIYSDQSGFVESNHPYGEENFMVLIKRGADKVNSIKAKNAKEGKK